MQLQYKGKCNAALRTAKTAGHRFSFARWLQTRLPEGLSVVSIAECQGPLWSRTVRAARITDPRTTRNLDIYFSPSFTGGIFVAAGAILGAGQADVIVSQGIGGSPEVRVFNGTNGSLLRDFNAFPPPPVLVPVFGQLPPLGGYHVGAVDVPGGYADILLVPPEVKVLDGMSLATVDDFFAYSTAFLGGVFVGGRRAGEAQHAP
jgi:hypothetical protein